MNREIKFRYFNPDKIKIVEWDEILDMRQSNGQYASDCEFPIGMLEDAFLNWMQYTGLKDKNGKEIYEGDLLIGGTSYELDNDERNWTKENPCKVEWYEECAGFNPFLLNARWRCDVINIEVIGNIYENPEFLK